MRFKTGQEIIDKLRGKKTTIPYYLNNNLPKTSVTIPQKQIIAIGGFYYSGSSAILDLLSECENVKSYGVQEIWSANSSGKIKGVEIKFFTEGFSIFKLVESFYYQRNNLLEQDIAIKRFIQYFYDFHYNKNFQGVYNQNFVDITIKLLENILDLTDDTKIFMKNKRYPHCLESKEELFPNCNFIFEKGINQYLFYKFKNISDDKFNSYIADYLYNFFNNLGTENSQYIICDQLFSITMLLDRMNFFMNERPIKEVCVYRDPRDQFLSAFRNDIFYLPRTIKGYIDYYNYCLLKINDKSPNRLCVRFEDLVYKYEDTKNKIFNFLEIPLSQHVAPKTIFDPNISKMNIGAYKKFHDQNFMEQIEKHLKKYCYCEES